MRLEELLASVPVNQWKVGKLYSSDWYDGPREGGCSLVCPECEFYFELLDERFNPDGLDDRLFRVGELPPGSVEKLLRAHALGGDGEIREVTAKKRPTPLVISSPDLEHFLGCWTVDRAAPDVRDWFAFLKIPPAHPTSVA